MEKSVLEEKLSFSHFSHDHPLKHTNSSPNDNSFCSACKLKISYSGKDYYSCKTCPFFLHQVCYNMPKKKQHPAHQTHRLTLQTSPLMSAEATLLKCKACGDHINGGFYYSCAECGLCYHILCSALPLSISVSSHPHELKLTFSPPYNFSCDICSKPSYNGWLYRCQICEFDTHLLCAISYRRVQYLGGQHRITPLANPLNPQISTYSSSSTSSLMITMSSSADHHSPEMDEIMHLVTQGLGGRLELVQKNAVSGWDSGIYSPEENLNVTRTQVAIGAFHQTESNQSLHQSPLTPASEDSSTIPSYQFSDACFSIDLAKSYSSHDPKKQAKNEANNDNIIQSTKGAYVPEVFEERISHGNTTTGIANWEQSDSKPEKQLGYGNGSDRVYSFKDGMLKEAFLIRSENLIREQKMGKKSKANNVTRSKSAIENQSSRSETDSSSGSSWQKLLLCCHNKR